MGAPSDFFIPLNPSAFFLVVFSALEDLRNLLVGGGVLSKGTSNT